MPIELENRTYYNLNEVSEFVGRSRISIWRWKQQKMIPQGYRYRGKELVFTLDEVKSIYAYAHRITKDEAAAELKNQLTLF